MAHWYCYYYCCCCCCYCFFVTMMIWMLSQWESYSVQRFSFHLSVSWKLDRFLRGVASTNFCRAWKYEFWLSVDKDQHWLGIVTVEHRVSWPIYWTMTRMVMMIIIMSGACHYFEYCYYRCIYCLCCVVHHATLFSSFLHAWLWVNRSNPDATCCWICTWKNAMTCEREKDIQFSNKVK